MNCNRCGATLNNKDKFCNNCGNKVKGQNKYIVFSIISLIFSLIAKFISFGFSEMFGLIIGMSTEASGGGAIAIAFIVIIVIILAIIILAMIIISIIFSLIVIISTLKNHVYNKKQYICLSLSCISIILILSILIGLF